MNEVLIIEDERVFADNIRMFLEKRNYSTAVAYTGRDGLKKFGHLSPLLVLLDMRLGDMSGIEVIQAIRAQGKDVPVIIMTAYGSIEIAVEAMKSGATDFLTKPVSLKLIVDKVAEFMQTQGLKEIRSCDEHYVNIIVGNCDQVQSLRQQIIQLVKLEAQAGFSHAPPVLITGETGTGKELVARALHYAGPRREGPLIEINCSALPADLVESELFGYVKGAFTGAAADKTGLIRAADGGTLFLDEIADMPLMTQLKLLKVLEEKEVRPLGATTSYRVNIRVVAASNQPLELLIKQGRFRQDLYYRICIISLEAPPLRERGEDIVVLAKKFLEEFAQIYQKKPPLLASDATRLLLAQDWPGNVRQLRNLMEKLILTRTEDILTTAILESEFSRQSSGKKKQGMNLYTAERNMLEAALEKTQWNVTAAARLLGITRDTLRYRIKRYELQSGMHEKRSTEIVGE